MVVNRDYDGERRLWGGLGAEASANGIIPQVRAQLADEAAYRACARLSSGEKAHMKEQWIFAWRDREWRKLGKRRGEAPAFPPALRAVVQERGGEMTSRDGRVSPDIEVAVEEPAAHRRHEVAGKKRRLARGSTGNAEKRAGDPKGCAKQPQDANAAGDGVTEDGKWDLRRSLPTGWGELAGKDLDKASDDVRGGRGLDVEPGAEVGEGRLVGKGVAELTMSESLERGGDERRLFLCLGRRTEFGNGQVTECGRKKSGRTIRSPFRGSSEELGDGGVGLRWLDGVGGFHRPMAINPWGGAVAHVRQSSATARWRLCRCGRRGRPRRRTGASPVCEAPPAS